MRLQPIDKTLYNDTVNSVMGQVGDEVKKRIGGGRVQMGIMTFANLADVIVPVKEGYHKQKKSKWEKKTDALLAIFSQYGWPVFDKAVVIAVIRKWSIDPKGGFIPLAPGTMDIEAGLDIRDALHKEAVINGLPDEESFSSEFAQAITEKVGITTEYGNGDSIEFVVPFYTPGIWQEVEDNEFHRRTAIIIVTPVLILYCEGMSVNSLQEPPHELLSVKTVEAIKIAQQLCRECKIS